ncbi:MAG: GGDEF domain-containing protein [Erysipelotrichaceae bacterium]|nr:GGDEF domain-containing protein [Erysipelotrichaceae bacterium]
MNYFFVHYTEANVVCIIIFLILLVHDLFGIDRQEKQIKYDNALISFIFYFAVDCLWSALVSAFVKSTRFLVVIDSFFLYLGMVFITYFWMEYALAVQQYENRNDMRFRIIMMIPFIVSTLALIVTYFINPTYLINDALEVQDGFNVFLLTAPYINLAATIYYSVRKAISEENPSEKRKYLFIGLFPLMVVACGLIETFFFPYEPIFAYSSTILMLVFFIQMILRQVSVDPLTGLNNRGQLLRYTSQKANLRKDNRLTYVAMFDINNFKLINDTYGHAQGDKALIILSDTFKKVISRKSFPVFLARYGGDEFIMIIHPASEKELIPFIEDIREELKRRCVESNIGFNFTVGIGYDELKEEPDTFQKCQQRADKKLYLDKKQIKQD